MRRLNPDKETRGWDFPTEIFSNSIYSSSNLFSSWTHSSSSFSSSTLSNLSSSSSNPPHCSATSPEDSCTLRSGVMIRSVQ